MKRALLIILREVYWAMDDAVYIVLQRLKTAKNREIERGFYL